MEENVKRFFESWPGSYRLYIFISAYINSLDKIRTDVMGTQISFGTKRKFTWIWLPQTWTSKRPSSSITVTFVLHRKIEDAQIESVVQAAPGVWTHHTVVEKIEDFSDKVKDWIREAYEQSL